MTESDRSAHSETVRNLWEDFGRGANRRVPIVFATDEAVWLKQTGNTFREFYTDPQVQLRVQLEGQAWFAENILHDRPLGPPNDAWTLGPRFWMDETEFFGCETSIQEHDFAWSMPLEMEKGDLLARFADLDPVQRVQESRLWKLYCAMKESAQGMTFHGLPVRIAFPGRSTHGLFTIAARVRGDQRFCLDMLDDPGFASAFLNLVTEKLIARIQAWHRLADSGTSLPVSHPWSMADDSLQYISRDMCERFVLPCLERIFSAMTTGERHFHLCGHSEQHFRPLYERLGIRLLDGPGTFVDHGALFAGMPLLRINAQANHTLLMLGPASAIDRMVLNMLTSRAKQPGRFQIMGFITPQTPLVHLQAMYEAGKEHGRIE